MVWGIVAGLGPGLQEGLNAKEDRAASKSRRTIDEAQEARNAEKHEWLKGMADIFQFRNAVDDLEKYRQWYSGGLYQPQPAQPKPVGGDATNQTVQQALPALQTINNMGTTAPQIPGMAEGGLAQVPQQPQQPPQQMMGPQALPVQQPQQPQQPAPQQDIPGRRERYNQWYNQAAKYAILNGGLEGYGKFEEMENAASRRQVLGYALQAVNAMDQGNVGEAMRAGNAALEVTPFDTGLKFTAENGNLYMVGQDGKKGQPLNADMLRAFTDDHMKTPEQYLDWKKQYETERSNLTTEKETKRSNIAGEKETRRSNIEREKIAAKNAESTRQQVEQYIEEGPSREALRGAQGWNALATGVAAMQRADAAKMPNHLAWSTSDLNTLERDITDAVQGSALGFSGPWAKPVFKDSPLGSAAIGLVKDIRRTNNPEIMSNDTASAMVRVALMNAVEGVQEGEPLVRGARAGYDADTDKWYVNLPGVKDPVYVPALVGIGFRSNVGVNEQMLNESTQPTPEATGP